MYLRTVLDKVRDLELATGGNTPSIRNPECITCGGTGRRPLTEAEAQYRNKYQELWQHCPAEVRHTEGCDCINPEHIRWEKNMEILKYMRNISGKCGIPQKYSEMCFASWKGEIHRDYYEFVENKQHVLDGMKKRGFLFAGPPGVGKTHLGVAMLNALMTRHYTPCLYVDVSDLLMQLRDTYNVNKGNGCYNELDLLRKYSTAEALMLDDISVEKVTEWTRDKLFQIVNYRYCNNMLTIVTSNDHPDVLAEKIGDRTVSRLNDLTEFVEVKGEDMRGRPIV